MLPEPDFDTDLRLETTVLGLPVVFETNSADVVDLARASYGGQPAAGARRAPLRVRIVTDPALRADDAGPPVASLPNPNRLELRVGAGRAVAEAARGEAVASVSPESVAASGFREGVLDHLVLFLATHWDRCPLHAGAVACEGRALLLAGPSGLGKSSLTYAAMKRGLRVLSDDVVYVQRDPILRLWSLPRRIHLPATAARHFPELEGLGDTVRPDGRRKIPVDIPANARARVPWQGSVGLCVLSAASGNGDAVELSPEGTVAEMRATLQGGFRRFAGALDACVREIAAGGCWRLPVTLEPMSLAERLAGLLRSLPRPGDR
jgi:hypothetical protein